jgi:hypothetical protein
MSLSEARFHDLVDATQQALEDLFDESDLDLDMENSAGVLTVKFERQPADLQPPGATAPIVAGGQVPVVSTSTTTKSGKYGVRKAKSCWARCSSASSGSVPARSWTSTKSDMSTSPGPQAAVQQCQPSRAVTVHQRVPPR